MTTENDTKIVMFLGGPLCGECREISMEASHYYVPVFNPPAITRACADAEVPALNFDRVEYRIDLVRSKRGPECVAVGIAVGLGDEEVDEKINKYLGGF